MLSVNVDVINEEHFSEIAEVISLPQAQILRGSLQGCWDIQHIRQKGI